MLPITKHFVLFVVADPAACRDFYVEHFGFEVEVDIGWYVVLTSGSERPMGLGFLQADHPDATCAPPDAHDRRPLHHVRGRRGRSDRGRGSWPPASTSTCPLRDEPWGQRHLIVRDPGGNAVDIVQNIAPDREFARQWFKMAV